MASGPRFQHRTEGRRFRRSRRRSSTGHLGRHAVPGPLVESYALDADVATPYVVDGDAVCHATTGALLTSVDPARRLFEVRSGEWAGTAAADAAYLAARTALQVHGAIGYTREHAMAWALLKVRALRSAWGTQTWHRRRVLTSLRSR